MAKPSHALTTNRWSVEDDPEYGQVRLSHIHQLERTRQAIEAIARMVGNSVLEPDASGATPLDPATMASLMGGVESLCDQLGQLGEAMREDAVGFD